ncbi:conserved unknown protein [Ectocarpus siliculosus]|uniref:RING-type domain-containing protein n=1 Tax=Ectocarpus siliculosus TaxID=2880 RepID=D7G6S6_ECTSI|nr:conserved unknown protein [Ectocarpus siliculosus]|eukprot:CBJ27620.1 conserved unknown protein [Ectocarpus siliculosus]
MSEMAKGAEGQEAQDVGMGESGKGPEPGTEEEAPWQEVRTCLLCFNKLRDPSVKYQANPSKENASGLIIATGSCWHVFHLDCIQRCLMNQSLCPVCENKGWEFAAIIHLKGYPRVES